MARNQHLILNRYRPLGEAGSGGFGAVYAAWDTRIQRKVAIKCIQLSDADAARAALPGADAVSQAPAAAERAKLSTWDAGDSSWYAEGAEGPAAETAAFATRQLSNPDDIPPWEDLPADAATANAAAPAAAAPRNRQRPAVTRRAPVRARTPIGRADAKRDIADFGSLSSGESISLTGDGPLIHTLARIPGLDEARTAAMLTDANIVTVYDFEVQGTMAYLIMEYVEGITLSRLLHDYGDQLSFDAITAVFDGVSHALEVAHRAGVLHLDIKPDNVMINQQGQVKVTDFGLATLADASGYGTTGGGTIGYMPLEQMRQENLDARCDQWALASVTYEMISGTNPFLAEDLPRAEAIIEDAELVLPSLCWDELDTEADDVIFMALDPEREERYESVADFADELTPFLGDARQGSRELAALVSGDDDEEEPAEDDEVRNEPRTPLRERIEPLHRRIGAHVVGAAGSALLAFVALANMPQTSGFENPLFWGLLALIALAGGLKPHLGVLLGSCALAAMLIVQNVPAAGCVLLAGAVAWWYRVGRVGNAEANAALAAPLGGAVGLGALGPLAAGFCLRPARAAATALFGAMLCTMLAGLGSQSLWGWDGLANWDFGTHGANAAEMMAAMLVQPAFWCGAASWVAAAWVCALLRQRPTRAFAVLGVCAAAVLLACGLVGQAWVASNGTAWVPDFAAASGTAVAVLAALVFCQLVPDPQYYDDCYEEEEAEPAEE